MKDKAILEFDAPESCAECPLLAKHGIITATTYTELKWCVFCSWKGDEVLQPKRAPFCPLKIVPDTTWELRLPKD